MTSLLRIAQRTAKFCDPHDCTDNSDVQALLEAVFDAPVRRDGAGRFVPALATSWENTEQGRVWSLNLRERVSFHDGSAFDATVMRACLERMQREDIGATLGAPAVWRQYLGGAEIKETGSHSLEIRLREPIADLLDILVSAYALPPSLMDAEGFMAAPIGTGAYRVERIEGEAAIILRRNSDWWGESAAAEEVQFLAEPDETVRREMVASGKAEIATRLSPAASAEERILYQDPTSIIFLLNSAIEPLSDNRVRKALSLLLDRSSMIEEVLNGAGVPLLNIVSNAHFGVKSDASDGKPDVAAAKQLISEAGYADGMELTVYCPTKLPDQAQQLTALLGEQLAAAGIKLQVRLEEDRVLYAETVRAKNISNLCVFDSSPMSTFRVLYEKIDSRVKGSWWQGFQSEAVEALLDTARTEADQQAREGLYAQALTALRDDPPWLTLYTQTFEASSTIGDASGAFRPDGVLDVSLLSTG